jgi:spermidine synthase
MPVSPATGLLELPSPFQDEDGCIRVREPFDSDREVLSKALLSGTYAKPFILENAGERLLHFSLDYVQSAMLIDRPAELLLEYTRQMTSFLLLHADPRKILLLGLGGGSLAKFCHARLPAAHVTAVEIDPDVIALRDAFCIPVDGERFRVVQGDAGQFVGESKESFDVVVTDAFGRYAQPASISTRAFYQDVRTRLTPAGVLVSNLAGKAAERQAHLDLMRDVFKDNLLAMRVKDGGNILAFAFRDANFEPRWRWIRQQAKALHSRFGIDFPKYAVQLEHNRKAAFSRPHPLESWLG